MRLPLTFTVPLFMTIAIHPLYSNYARDGRSENRIPLVASDFIFSKKTSNGSGSYSKLFSGYQGSFPGEKLPERDVCLRPTSGAEVKTEWSCACKALMCLHGVELPCAFVVCTGRLYLTLPLTLLKNISKCKFIGSAPICSKILTFSCERSGR